MALLSLTTASLVAFAPPPPPISWELKAQEKIPRATKYNCAHMGEIFDGNMTSKLTPEIPHTSGTPEMKLDQLKKMAILNKYNCEVVTQGSACPTQWYGYVNPETTAIVDSTIPPSVLTAAPFDMAVPCGGPSMPCPTKIHTVYQVPKLTLEDRTERMRIWNSPGMPGATLSSGCIWPGGSPLGAPYCGVYVKTEYAKGCKFFAEGVGQGMQHNGFDTAMPTTADPYNYNLVGTQKTGMMIKSSVYDSSPGYYPSATTGGWTPYGTMDSNGHFAGCHIVSEETYCYVNYGGATGVSRVDCSTCPTSIS